MHANYLMHKLKPILLIALLNVFFANLAVGQTAVKTDSTWASESEVTERYLKNGAWKVNYFSTEYQLYIDSAIAANPTIAYLYQQKAMPYFKQQKYELGMQFLDKAVALKPTQYIDYRAFIKCIFYKTYSNAITDFEMAKTLKGENGYVMDHSYNFYIGLCHLQLGQFKNALTYLQKSMDYRIAKNGNEWVHFLEQFYLGICYQELGQHMLAINYFNMALKSYSNFSDAKYYKAKSLMRLNQTNEANQLYQQCVTDYQTGYTINEDNSIYEFYPYQLKKFMVDGIAKQQK